MIRNWTSSDKVDALSFGAEVFFTRLIMTVDDFGRFHANPKLLKSALYPLKEIKLSDIEKWLNECTTLLRVYEVDGKQYLEITDFNQRLRLKTSKFPDMPVICPSIDRQVSDKCPPEVETEARNGSRSEKRETEIQAEAFNFKSSLLALGISKSVVDDWLKVRKAKKATNSETAFIAIEKEIIASGRSPDECITEAVARSWAGFKAEWMNNNIKTPQNGITTNKPRTADDKRNDLLRREMEFLNGSIVREGDNDQQDASG